MIHSLLQQQPQQPHSSPSSCRHVIVVVVRQKTTTLLSLFRVGNVIRSSLLLPSSSSSSSSQVAHHLKQQRVNNRMTTFLLFILSFVIAMVMVVSSSSLSTTKIPMVVFAWVVVVPSTIQPQKLRLSFRRNYHQRGSSLFSFPSSSSSSSSSSTTTTTTTTLHQPQPYLRLNHLPTFSRARPQFEWRLSSVSFPTDEETDDSPSLSTDLFDISLTTTIETNTNTSIQQPLTPSPLPFSNPDTNQTSIMVTAPPPPPPPPPATIPVPSYRTLLIFSMTTVLIWLSEPLLSLVDTTIVGQYATGSATASVIQLASLGPATTYIDSLFYTTYFLSIATTNIVARNLAVRNYQQLYRTVSHVITVATLLGLFCTVFTLLVGVPFLLPSMVGPSGMSATAATAASSTTSLLFYARRYVYIRASVAIASIISITSQSILLATKDTMTPALAVMATSVTNIVGDILLRYYGVQGAAIATALATIVSCTILLRAVYQQYTAWKQLHVQSENYDNNSRVIEATTSPTTTRYSPPPQPPIPTLSFPTTMMKDLGRKILRPGKSILSMLSLPDKEATLQLVTLAGPYVFICTHSFPGTNKQYLRIADTHPIFLFIF